MRTRVRIRNTVFLIIGLVVCWLVYDNWNRITPAIESGTEKAFDAAREVTGDAP